MPKRLIRAVAAVIAGTVLAVSAPLAASAHVRIDPDTAQPGDYSYVNFRVPNESATASTIGVSIQLPTATPLTAVSYQPVPGWTAKIATTTLPKPVTIGGTEVTSAPTEVTFTATDGGIAPGQFGVFTLSLGKVPDVGRLLLPATQSYSDGTVVKWDQPTPTSGAEPEYPAPTLFVKDPPAGASAPERPADHGLTIAAIIVGFAGLVIGAAGVVVAVLALSRTRRRA